MMPKRLYFIFAHKGDNNIWLLVIVDKLKFIISLEKSLKISNG
jgi:hypothetical protein